MNALSRSDRVGKTLAFLQTCWLLVGLTGRVDQHLPVTTFEFCTPALAICALISYGFW